MGMKKELSPRTWDLKRVKTGSLMKTGRELRWTQAQTIEELKRLFPDEDTVTDDVEHLEEHGFSENDYHPSKFTSQSL